MTTTNTLSILGLPVFKKQELNQANSILMNTPELVIFDPGVDNLQQLIDGIKPGMDWAVLNPNQDGIEQITRILANYSEIKTLHLVSHGAPGCLFLGNSQLSLETIEGYATQLQSWFAASPPSPQHWRSKDSKSAIVEVPMIGDLGVDDLQPPSSQYWRSKDSKSASVQSPHLSKAPLLGKQPSILLYGCKVAAGDAGAEFLTKLYQITQAQIYANPRPTGNAALGGTWSLQPVFPPTPDTLQPTPFDPETLTTYQGILGDADLDPTFGGGDGIVTTDFGSGDDAGYGITIDEDGKILVGGPAWNGSNYDFALVRYGNEAPSDISLDNSSIAENSAYDTTVGTLSTTDADTGDSHTYTLLNDASGRFKLISGDQIQVANSSLLDYESATSHTITVRTTDLGGLTYVENLTINLTNVNDETPEVNNQSFSVGEDVTNGATVGTVVANDVDGDSLTYSITAGNDDGIFAIDPSSGEITIADGSKLDFETTADYSLTVEVSDTALVDSATVNVNITDANDVPEIDNQTFN